MNTNRHFKVRREMKRLKTRWAEQVDKEHVLTEYPRPTLVRDSYVNLNGLWNYAITDEKRAPEEYEGKILVPFSPEAPLSGVERQLKPKEYLWYQRELPDEIRPEHGKRWILHFGAVDQYAAVRVNGKTVKKHLGGYLPFSIDITDVITEKRNILEVRVQDYSDKSYYSRGKQKLKRGGMFYTAQSGIWQTVWAEQVPENYISGIRAESLYDEKVLRIVVKGNTRTAAEKIKVVVSAEDMQPLEVRGNVNEPIDIYISDMHSWSPEDPYLYHIELWLGTDHVTSYAAMRKISVEKDTKGILRMFLNGKPYFQKGLLDQGYWPEGLYTPPCDEAMLYDIRLAKRLGFNMLRKHVKLEPQRWYYHCDREGMLVWQDMVCGGRAYKSWYVTYLATIMELFHIRLPDCTLGLLGRRDARGRKQFMKETEGTVSHLYNHPSIVTWVIFNEGWGQFHAKTVTETVREIDGTRLLDQASGWFDQGGGDIRSIHNYFFPLNIRPEINRTTVLTEFGGYCLGVDGHRMFSKEYGYRTYKIKEGLTKGYGELIESMVLPNISKGLSGVIYTQLSDIEEEVNGIITYDREIVKINENLMKKWNEVMRLDG